MKKIQIFLILYMPLLCFGQAKHTSVKLHSTEGYSQYEDFAKKAAFALEKVINSAEFKQSVLDTKFIKTNGLKNEQLYNMIMNAHEINDKQGEDGVIDLRVRTLRIESDEAIWRKRCEGSTIGIDGTGDGVTAICPNKLAEWAKQNEVGELAGHFAHEYMHLIGFDHYNFFRRDQSWKDKTFVYIIGNVVADLVDKENKK